MMGVSLRDLFACLFVFFGSLSILTVLFYFVKKKVLPSQNSYPSEIKEVPSAPLPPPQPIPTAVVGTCQNEEEKKSEEDPNISLVIAAALQAYLKSEENLPIVIAAALRATLGKNYRVISIEPQDSSYLAWSREGRREIWGSHRLK